MYFHLKTREGGVDLEAIGDGIRDSISVDTIEFEIYHGIHTMQGAVPGRPRYVIVTDALDE